MSQAATERGTTAFVLGGGGLKGAAEVGMALALAETGIRPDLVFGTSIGAVNGAVLASGELAGRAAFLERAWHDLASTGVLQERVWGRIGNMVRHGTHLHANDGLRNLVLDWLPQRRFDELAVPFECSAACIETSSEAWFDHGPLVDPILASCAVPSLLPPVEVGGLHYIDGGVVNSIPISRAIERGATTIYVLHVGNIDAPLVLPRTPWDIAFVSFEIARRHRFNHDLANLPDGVTVHVLPTGSDPDARYNDVNRLRYHRRATIRDAIERARRATSAYLVASGV